MKLGIVFEGGASRSLFTCGVIDALLEENIFADYVIGVSAGIAYGSSYISRQKGRNLELSLKYMNDKRYMGMKHLLNPKNRSYYNREFAFRRIPEKLVPYDFEGFKKYSENTSAIAVLTNVETGKAEYKELSRTDWDLHINTVWASCALPLLFKPEALEGSLYMDGGIADPVPFKKALSDGCDKVIVVLTRERSYSKASESSSSIASKFYRKYPNFCDSLKKRAINYNKDREDLFKMEKAGEVFVVAPTDTTGFSRTERRPEKLKEMYDDGYNATKKQMNDLKKYIGI